MFHFGIREFIWDTVLAKKTLIVGLPIALQMAIASLGFTFIQRAVNGFRKAMTASFTVGQRIEMYLISPATPSRPPLPPIRGKTSAQEKWTE